MRSVFVVLLTFGGPAAAVEYQPGTQPRTVQLMPPTDGGVADNQLPPSLQLERAQYCLGCHSFGAASASSTSPGAMWLGTMMANAARDPLMYAALAVANQDVPGIGGDYCLRCHSPAGFTAGHTVPNPQNANNNYPCHVYAQDSLATCTVECREDAAHIANGYCIVAFDDRPAAEAAFKGHPTEQGYAAPEPYTQQPTTDANGHVLDPFDDEEGLSCAFCHRVDPSVPFNRLYGGDYHLSTLATQQAGWATPRSVRFGPYADVLTNCTNSNDKTTCVAPHPHDAQQSAFLATPEFCGQCHDVTNPLLPRLDASGTSMGFNMPIERTYSEWKASDRSKPASGLYETCQGCHMPKPADTGGATTLGGVCRATNTNPYNRGGTGEELHQHEFVGGNVFLPTVFANVMAPVVPDGGGSPTGDPRWFYDLINGANRQGAYVYVAQAATQKLQSAATLQLLNKPAMTASGANLMLDVHIENNTGHKLPTGYPEGRRMWIQVIATVPTQSPSPFFVSGGYDDTTGVLTKDAQVKIYEVEMTPAGFTGPANPPQFHFATNQIVWKDNRIPPVGFDPNDPNFAEMAPVGATYPLFNGKLQSWDDTIYSVPVPAFATGDVQVIVRLLYQTASKDYIDFLRNANTTNPRGQEMTTIWQNHGRSAPVEMASTTITIKNAAPCVPTPEICDGKDNDCNGIIDDPPACDDMAVPLDLAVPADDLSAPADDLPTVPDDLAASMPADLAPRVPPSGCGVSIAGHDFSDLAGPAWLLVALALLWRRRAIRR